MFIHLYIIPSFPRFGVKYDRERDYLLFPLTKPDGEVTGLIIYNLNNVNPSIQQQQPPGIDPKEVRAGVGDNNVVDVVPRSLNVPIGLFGWSAVPPETTEIILCANVFDVMLLSQARPALVALSLPKGEFQFIVLDPCRRLNDILASCHQLTMLFFSRLPGNCRLPQHELPQLEVFKRVTIWFDNDVQSWQQAKLFAQKLNDKRCR